MLAQHAVAVNQVSALIIIVSFYSCIYMVVFSCIKLVLCISLIIAFLTETAVERVIVGNRTQHHKPLNKGHEYWSQYKSYNIIPYEYKFSQDETFADFLDWKPCAKIFLPSLISVIMMVFFQKWRKIIAIKD